MKKKAKAPLSSFDPRMIQLLIKGSRERIVIPFLGPGGKAKGHIFHRRLHTLRARMRDNNPPHEHSDLVGRTHIRLLWGRKAHEEGYGAQHFVADHDGTREGAFMILAPRDSEYDLLLSSLDLQVPELPPLEESPEELSNWLSNLGKEVEK